MTILGTLTGTTKSNAFEKAVQMDTIYIDFLKTFDKVNQDFRVHKLQAGGRKFTCQIVFSVYVPISNFISN